MAAWLRFILTLSLFALSSPLLSQVEDLTPPTLTAFEFHPTAIDTGTSAANITVNFTLIDDLSGVKRLDIAFSSPTGGQVQRSVNFFTPATSVSGSASISFPQFSETGSWKATGFYLQDAASNYRSLNTQDLVNLGFPTELTVTGQTDRDAPNLTAFSFSPATIDTSTGSASVTVNFIMTDSLAGVRRFDIAFASPTGGQVQRSVNFFTPATSVSGSASITFPQFSEAGTWKATGLYLEDAASNYRSLNTQDLVNLGFPTELTVTGQADRDGPNLTAFSFSPTTINTSIGPASVTVNFTLTDRPAGVRRFDVAFTSPSGGQVQRSVNFFTPGPCVSGSTSISFPQFSENGTWKATGVYLEDAASNYRGLNTQDLVNLGFPTDLVVIGRPVGDATPPVIGSVSDLTVEATSPTGAVVTFALPSATDNADPAPVVTASPASGDMFALGMSTVTVTAKDSANNTSTKTFIVTIRDTTPPAIGSVNDIAVGATSPAGAVVIFATPTATDAVDPAPAVIASPASGSAFPVGSTMVTVTAADAAGNSSTKTFTVTVRSAAQQISGLLTTVAASFPQASGLLQNSLASLNAGHTGAACNEMNAFISQVQAQSGKKLTVAQADQLIASANQIKGAIGCP